MPGRVGATIDRRSDRRAIRRELAPTFRLALPVVASELSWIFMGVVDTLMVGGLGPEAIGAVSLGSALHVSVFIFGVGLLLGLDPIAAQAFGAGRLGEARRSLVQAVYLALLAAPPMIGVQLLASYHLGRLGITPEVATLAGPYLRAMAWSTAPLMVFSAVRHYLQAAGKARAVTWAMVSANLVNWLGNWLLIRGHLGLPALGVVGSGWSTLAARTFLAAVVLAAVVALEGGRGNSPARVSLALDPASLARLVRLGLPAALHYTIEVGAFGLATVVAGWMGPVALAAHQVVLNVSSTTFMVPLGISAAASIRVGHATGRGDPREARAAGWAAIGLGAGVMGLAAVALLAIPRTIASAFTDDPAALDTATRLLRVAAAFQLFDGLQISTVGALRGLGDTRTAMFATLLAHWALGLPIGAALGFGLGGGVVGLWVGLSIGLVVAAVVLVAAWVRRTRGLA